MTHFNDDFDDGDDGHYLIFTTQINDSNFDKFIIANLNDSFYVFPIRKIKISVENKQYNTFICGRSILLYYLSYNDQDYHDMIISPFEEVINKRGLNPKLILICRNLILDQINELENNTQIINAEYLPSSISKFLLLK